MTVDVPPVAVEIHHLLGHPVGLDGHLAALGPLPIPVDCPRGWGQSLLTSLEISGLKGRGGAAFPTSVKLAAARARGGGGVLVVNGMESEPASDKDSVLLTLVPHLVLDGAQLLAAACGADRVVVCIPVGREQVTAAVHVAIVERMTQSYARVPEEIVRPPAQFVAGEESALVQWINSGSSRPSFRPDKGAVLRIGKRPALVQNAETLAHIALIARHGPESFRTRGTEEEPGTTLVTISGAVAHPGVVEVDRGTSLNDIVSLSIPREPIRALLVGGYGGAWVEPRHFAIPYTAHSLRTVGASAGVGIIVALGVSACGVAETARVASFLAGQSSGQCGPCVFGLRSIAEDLRLLAQGRSEPGMLSRLVRRLDQVNGRGACHHPDGAVGMVRSALRVFVDDVAAHDHGAPCPHWSAITQLRFPDGARE